MTWKSEMSVEEPTLMFLTERLTWLGSSVGPDGRCDGASLLTKLESVVVAGREKKEKRTENFELDTCSRLFRFGTRAQRVGIRYRIGSC